MAEAYDLDTVTKTYSYWGRSLISYQIGTSFFGYTTYLRKKAVSMLGLKKGDVVIDLACGPGPLFRRIMPVIGKKGKLIAIDYVPEMISQCKKQVKRKRWDNVVLICEDAAKIDQKIKKGSVDKIVSIIGLSAIPNYKKAIRNCHLLLKKGGSLVFLDGKDFNAKFRFLNILLKLIRWEKSYQRRDLISEAKKVFGNVEVKEYLLGSTYIARAVKK